MGIMDHVRESMPTDGRFVDKAQLVNSRVPFGIAAIRYEPSGTQRYPVPRWVSTITPWIAGTALPGVEPGEVGKISMNGNPMRDPMFQELSRMVQASGAPIGPLVLTQAISKSGQRVFLFEDYNPAPAIPTPGPQMAPVGMAHPAGAWAASPPGPAPAAAAPLPAAPATAPAAPATGAIFTCAACHEQVTGQYEHVASVNRMGLPHNCRILGPIHVFG